MIEIRKVYVVGAGVMGNAIAHVLADSGYEVKLCDLQEEIINETMANIEDSLERFVKGGKKTDDEKNSILSRISPSFDMKDASESDYVIEAAYEDLSAKKGLFTDLDKICKEETILGTNTSSLPISPIAVALNGRP